MNKCQKWCNYKECTVKKLRLDLNELAVESFDTALDEVAKAGTVRGHVDTDAVYCGTGDGTCAIQSCQYSGCWGAYETCQCAQTNVGTCYYQLSCNGNNCVQSAWCQNLSAGPSCESCVAAHCPGETGGC
jgi:hypothetical protein